MTKPAIDVLHQQGRQLRSQTIIIGFGNPQMRPELLMTQILYDGLEFVIANRKA